MVNAVKDGLKKLFDHALKSQAAMDHILKPAAEGAGKRIFPAQNAKNDAMFGIRIDKGEPLQGEPNIIRVHLQANKNAEKTTIRKMAEKDSHEAISYADVDNTQEATEENLSGVHAQFIANMKR